MRPTFLLVVPFVALASACATSPSTRAPPAGADRKQQVRDLLKALETGDTRAASVIDPVRYKQHNLGVADGVAGLATMLAQLPKGAVRVRPARVFQDGDFVFAHTEYDLFGPKVGFDVFRFDNGLVVEHWDNLQSLPASPNPSGHTMLDGPTEAGERDRTELNKATVRSFVDDVLVHGRLEQLPSFIDEPRYTQHSPLAGDGLSGLAKALDALSRQGIVMKYDRLHRVLGEGNFVLAVSEGSFGGRPTAFYDLFRLERGKLVEHWDTIEAIPPRAEWKNENGKF